VKKKNIILLCCSFLALSFIVGKESTSLNNSTADLTSYSEDSNVSKTNGLLGAKHSVNSVGDLIPAASLTYDFSAIDSSTSYKTFDATTFNTIGKDTYGYISEVEATNLYYGDSSQAGVPGLKLGKSSASGFANIKYKTSIKSVKIYATKYKTYTSGLIINDGAIQMIDAAQGEEPSVLTYTPSSETKELKIATTTEKVDGYALYRAWILKIEVELNEGSEGEAPVEKIVLSCAKTYRLAIGKTLRLQAFNKAAVVNEVEWNIVSGEEYCTLVGNKLVGTSAGVVYVEGSLEGSDSVTMKVTIGNPLPDSSVYTTVTDFKKEVFNVTPSNIKVKTNYASTIFVIKAKICGFDGPTSSYFYATDGTTTMYVYNKAVARKALFMDENVVITGKAGDYKNKMEIVPTSVKQYYDRVDYGELFGNTISSKADFTGISSNTQLVYENSFTFYTVNARFASLSGTTLKIFFSDAESSLITVNYITSFIHEESFDNYVYGDDVVLTAAFTVDSSKAPIFEYVSGSEISRSNHTYTGTVSGVAFSLSSEDVAISKTLDLSTLVTVSGTGDYNKNAVYTITSGNDKGSIKGSILTVNNVKANIGAAAITVTGTSVQDNTKSATLTINIIDNLKQTTLTVTSLAVGSSYDNNTTGTDQTITDSALTYKVGFYQVGNYGSGLQFRYKDSMQSSIFNTEVSPYYIYSITLNVWTGKTLDTNKIGVYGGTTAYSSTAITTAGNITTSSTGMSFEYLFGANDFNYFKIQHLTTGTSHYLASIVIVYKN